MTLNMFETKSDLPSLVEILENKEEDVIYIARNGVEVAQLTLVPKKNVEKRIGIAKGKFTVPENFDELFDEMDGEIADMFENGGKL